MPIQNYGLLRGQITNALPYKKGADHYQIELNAAGQLYRIAVDVYSAKKGSKRHYSPQTKGSTTWDVDREVMFYKDENYDHPILAKLTGAEQGLTPAEELPEDLLLDYLRYNPVLFPIDQMKAVPPAGDNADLNDDIDPAVQKAMNNANAELFVFGSSFDNSNDTHPDPTVYFDPNPSLGMHDVHMNQGDTGSEARSNGTFQDGALFFHFADTNTWTAMFFKFVNQSTKTDDNGDPS
jgi:uncharacterized protein YukJ